jgi:hypothetical protein
VLNEIPLEEGERSNEDGEEEEEGQRRRGKGRYKCPSYVT